jgi:hypothetical protein
MTLSGKCYALTKRRGQNLNPGLLSIVYECQFTVGCIFNLQDKTCLFTERKLHLQRWMEKIKNQNHISIDRTRNDELIS